jgi:hypothetical protein
MAEQESQQIVTGCPGNLTAHSGADALGGLSVPVTPISAHSDDDRPVGGISVIPIPRREIAHLKGTLRLTALPRHKPTIVFDANRPSQDADDE